jgi:hypothetical protein
MKYAINMPTSLRAAIKELGPYIRDDELSYRIKSYDGLLVREALGNWLVCAVLNDRNSDHDRYTFTTEPRDGPGADGAILDKTTGEALAAEHVMVAKRRDGQRPQESAEQLVLALVEKKLAKGGAAYASGKALVVYLDADVAGYSPRALREHLPADLAFEAVWLVVPQAGRWDYDVVFLGGQALDPPTYRVSIMEAFDDWTVTRLPWPPVVASVCRA